MELEKLGRLIDQWKALLTGIGLLLGAAVAVRKALIDLDPSAWSWPEIAVAAASACMLAIVIARSRERHVSRLVDPDALKLDPQSPDQLVGRREDLDKLLKALANPLVFLVSELGCGKSALLQAGVAQGPAFLQRYLPVYIDMSVLDWEDGPLRAVREGFAQALPNDDPARGKLDARSTPRHYAEAFGDYYRRTQRRPLLLLDQFDDYQAEPRHRERFLPPETRVWRTADAVARENAFWRMLRQCLQNDSVSIIVACREDAAQGLESLRFHPDVPQFDLPRLELGLVRLIIDRLTERPTDKPAVIAEPDGGWTALRDRLVDDLEARGQVLPQQLKVVLAGLRTLRRLTPAAYARAGRLAGLAAAFVAGTIRRAARTAALRDEDVLLLLLPLIDRTRQPPDKGPPQPARLLAETAGVPEHAASRTLERLEADEIVRLRSELQDAAAGWQLDHAYLAQPILRIERERDQWHRLLVERARAYAEASWRDKWGALLPLGVQARLIDARLRRRFRYGEQRAYALKSLSRALPAIAVVGYLAALTSGVYSILEPRRNWMEERNRIFVTLWEVDSHAAETLVLLREAIGKTTNPDQLNALARLYAAVARELKGCGTHAAEEFAAAREAIGKTKNPSQLGALAQAYAAIAKKACPATAPVQDVSVLLDRIGDPQSADQCQAFVAAILAALQLGSPPLTWDQAGLVVTAVLLQPVSAREPGRQLVNGYEELLRERPDAPKPAESWSGDVSAFFNWARENLPGFDPYRPNVGFLPSVASTRH